MKNKIYYWSPFISKVATVKSTINSAASVNKYLNENYEAYIIDVFGEFLKYEEEIKKKNIKIIHLGKSKLINFFAKPGFLRSRLLFIFIFLRFFFPLLNLLKKEPPSILVIHLITSLPLILNLIFKLKTKIILRISGFPKLNFLRKLLWKISLKKISMVTTPTISTFKDFDKHNIIDSDKLMILRDPIILTKEICLSKKEQIEVNEKNLINNNYFLAVGRLSRQKNFSFLIKNMKDFLDKDLNLKLVIIGEGEEKKKLIGQIKNYKLEERVILLGFKENVFKFLHNSKAFILSSLWEDPGFVLLEAAYLNIPIISSNCPNGPSEILDNGKYGFLFKSNCDIDFKEKVQNFLKCSNEVLKQKKINAKKQSKKFSLFNHSQELGKILNII